MIYLRQVPEHERPWAQLQIARRRGCGRRGMRVADRVEYQAEQWVLLDFDADLSVPEHVTAVLISQEFSKIARGIPLSLLKKVTSQ